MQRYVVLLFDEMKIRANLVTLYNVCSVHRGMFSTSGVFSTSGGYHEYIGGYHEYIGGCSVHWGEVMMNVGMP